MKILFISLGCDKNLADSEEMLGLLTGSGHEIVDSEEEADAIDRQFRIFDSLVGLEKQRITAIRDIAKAYYSNQPTIHYTQIVK